MLDDVTTQLHEAIISGRLQPGDRLPNERELAEVFSVGRPTLREALRVLEAFGLVEIRPGKLGGAFVTAPSEGTLTHALATLLAMDDVTTADLVEFRVSFEAENAWWAAQRATPDDVRVLREIAEEAENAATASRLHAFPEIDARWHGAVARMTKNRVRLSIFMAIYETLLRHNRAVTEPPAEVRDRLRRQLRAAVADMKKIADAIEAKDSEAARAQMRRHIERARLDPQLTVIRPSRAQAIDGRTQPASHHGR